MIHRMQNVLSQSSSKTSSKELPFSETREALLQYHSCLAGSDKPYHGIYVDIRLTTISSIWLLSTYEDRISQFFLIWQ